MSKEETGKQQIEIRDLAVAVEILKVASRRGAFELAELKTVGELGEKFAAVVQAASTPPADSPAEEAPATENA